MLYTQSHRINQMTERFSHFILKPVSSLRFGLFCTKFLLKIDRYWMATRRCTSFWTFSMRDSFYFIQYFINESIDCKSFGIDSVLSLEREKKSNYGLNTRSVGISRKKILYFCLAVVDAIADHCCSQSHSINHAMNNGN